MDFSTAGNEASFFLLKNIPEKLHSCDLRHIFSSLIDEEAFICFHYRHRRESKEFYDSLDIRENPKARCCVIILRREKSEKFIEECESVLDANKAALESRNLDYLVSIYDSKRREAFFNLSELTPPSYLPNGSIGTPTKVLHRLVSDCKVPTSVLKSLKLDADLGRDVFYCVPYNYSSANPRSPDRRGSVPEDWERHMQLHNDVTSQERLEERPFETEKEVTWEKGSSGLVHYTDVLYWNERAGKNDFDEETVDDWDVDMAIYDDPAAADFDSREMLLMREIEAATKGQTVEHCKLRPPRRPARDRCSPRFGEFERHTLGFGSRMLTKFGWSAGQPLRRGAIRDPIHVDPRTNKRAGLGYSESRRCFFKAPPAKEKKLTKISTAYDKVEEEEDTPLQSAELTRMKYR